MVNWYRKVTNDLKLISEFISYYENEYDKAKIDLSIKGKTVERNEAELPGIVEQRFTQLQEIEAVLEFLNVQYREKRSAIFKKFLESYPKALTSRDAEKYVDGDREVVDMALLVNEVALLRNKYLSIHKGLEQKGWMLGHITKLKCAGLDDATVE